VRADANLKTAAGSPHSFAVGPCELLAACALGRVRCSLELRPGLWSTCADECAYVGEARSIAPIFCRRGSWGVRWPDSRPRPVFSRIVGSHCGLERQSSEAVQAPLRSARAASECQDSCEWLRPRSWSEGGSCAARPPRRRLAPRERRASCFSPTSTPTRPRTCSKAESRREQRIRGPTCH
jgi:hypothetical protein